jgi:hypothetical protein
MSEISTRTIKKFYTLLFSGKISESEKTLLYIRKKIGDQSPYYNALYGIYYSYVNDDVDSYIFKLWERYLNGVDKKTLYEEVERLIEGSYNPPAGFLEAWLDLISMIDQLPVPHKIEKRESKSEGGITGEVEVTEELEEDYRRESS